jgi:hypothetical protein
MGFMIRSAQEPLFGYPARIQSVRSMGTSPHRVMRQERKSFTKRATAGVGGKLPESGTRRSVHFTCVEDVPASDTR